MRRVEEEASCRVRVLEEERVRLADRLAVMTAASVERSLSPMRRSGRAEQDTQTMQQENDRYACTCVGAGIWKSVLLRSNCVPMPRL